MLRRSTLSRVGAAVRRLSTQSPPNYRRMILESRAYDVAEQTLLQEAPALSHALQNRVLLKREDLQPVFSFKIRGAYNKMASLSDEEKAAGCVCCSAGNHAQGVALSARKLGVRAKIVMPLATPDIKVNAVRHHGKEFVDIVLHGKTFDDAAAEARRLVEEEKLTMILPFDDPYVIAGQGTIGMEILQQTMTSGANIDFARLRFVSERADSHERLLAVEIDENPGAFLRLNRRLDAVGVRITEFSYRYANAQKARVHLSFHSPSADHAVAAIRELQEEESPLGFARGGAYQVLDLSDNELAKVHTRYLAGGRARGDVQNERLYRFEFPDRPRALATFLEALQSSWNISLFHYRNHGADVGRVLVGFQVPEEDHERFQTFLNQLAYVFHEETDNQMYQEFML
ncbi:hypothetical protein JG687_00000228 [Phytophthora cactorum]|uniref:threonine ammonia-lyase n=1 Tax=Phytophthora cactorum TaxID=29920 RepID=A0A8T1V3C1_9STRA|nr:hypothetical protein JG687_00000228 [Phytophthora cactorum]